MDAVLAFMIFASFRRSWAAEQWEGPTREGVLRKLGRDKLSGAAVDRRECRSGETEFSEAEVPSLLAELKAFDSHTGPLYQVSRLSIFPCDRARSTKLSEDIAQVFRLRDASVAQIRAGGRLQTFQLTGATNPHEIQLGGRRFELYSIQIIDPSPKPPILYFDIRVGEMPSMSVGSALRRHLATLVNGCAVGSAIATGFESAPAYSDRDFLEKADTYLLCDVAGCSMVRRKGPRALNGSSRTSADGRSGLNIKRAVDRE